MRPVLRFAQSILLLAMFAFYSSATELKAAPIEIQEGCPSDYCADNYAYEHWNCLAGGGFEVGWDCFSDPHDECWYWYECWYPN